MFGRGNTNGIWIGIGIAAFLSLLAGWKMLKKAGLVTESREKNYIYYSLDTQILEEILAWLTKLQQ